MNDPVATVAPSALRPLYPLAPSESVWLGVPGGHELRLELSGAERGLPLLLLHGGPGSGLSPLLRRFADPARFRVIGVDQRGAGQSRPHGGTEHNTLADLLADLRRVRTHLGIGRWLVVGGSWGATLAVAHAADLPEAVAGLLLRGLFLARPGDIDGFFGPAPVAFDALRAEARVRGEHLTDALFRALSSADAARAAAVARAWWRHEQALAGNPAPAEPDAAALPGLVARYRIQGHYLRQGCGLRERPLLARAAALPPVPTRLLHGRLDRICPPDGAAAFAQAAPHAQLRWIDGAGHDPTHPAMVDAMVRALDAWADAGRFDDEGAAR